jgi:hypothetical protein
VTTEKRNALVLNDFTGSVNLLRNTQQTSTSVFVLLHVPFTQWATSQILMLNKISIDSLGRYIHILPSDKVELNIVG